MDWIVIWVSHDEGRVLGLLPFNNDREDDESTVEDVILLVG